jgi:hypothetical protein
MIRSKRLVVVVVVVVVVVASVRIAYKLFVESLSHYQTTIKPPPLSITPHCQCTTLPRQHTKVTSRGGVFLVGSEKERDTPPLFSESLLGADLPRLVPEFSLLFHAFPIFVVAYQ